MMEVKGNIKMKENKLIIIGTGNFAMMVYDYMDLDSDYTIVAFAVEEKYINGMTQLCGLPVVSFERMEFLYPPEEYYAIVAVGYPKLNRVRERLYLETKNKGYKCASYVSSKSFVWQTVSLGENCIIMEGAVVQYGASVGNNVVMWPLACVTHLCVVEDNCWIASGCVIAGICHVGKNSFLGVNSSIKGNTNIAKYSLIGAGVYIGQDTQEYCVYASNKVEDKLKDVEKEDRERFQTMVIDMQEKSDKKN